MSLRLLKASLWSAPLDLHGQTWTHEQYCSVMTVAREQAVVGLVAQALVDSGVKLERQDALEMFGMMQRIRQQNKMLNEAVTGLCKRMAQRGIRIFVFKGQTLATMYPDSGLRQSGDIDFGCHPDDWESCMSIFRDEMKLAITDNTTEKHISFNVSGIEYELHRKLAAFSYPRHRRYWAKEVMPEILRTLSSVNINGYDVPTLNLTYNALYVFVHIFYHLLDEGVGLRQFCDWAKTMENGKGRMDSGKREEEEVALRRIDKELLERHLRGLGLMKAYTGMGAILTDYLGLPEEMFPFEITKEDHKRAPQLFENMLEMGNFGHNKQYSNNSGILHGIQHLSRITLQSRRFYYYSPSEAWWRVPYMFNWWMYKIGQKLKPKNC